MNLNEFKLIKNRQRPDLCYGYEKKNNNRKYSIFTMDSGRTFLASITEPRLDGKWYSEYSETKKSIDECINAFIEYEN